MTEPSAQPQMITGKGGPDLIARSALEVCRKWWLIALLVGTVTLSAATPARATANSIAVVDPGVGLGWNSSLALDAVGNPVISYYDEVLNQLKVVHCGSQDCTQGDSIAVPDRELGNVYGATASPSTALDAAGDPVIGYSASHHDLKVLHCGDPNCLTGNSISTPVTTGRDNPTPVSLALDATGNPVISYLESLDVGVAGTVNDLTVLHCGNVDCTTGNSIAIADSLVNSPTNISLKLDGAGNPVVIYESVRPYPYMDNSPVKVLHCGNANCTSGNSVAIVDTVHRPSYALVSLALDAAGNPVAGYIDAVAGDLKLLHCGNPNCTSGNSTTVPDSGVGGSDPVLVGPPSLALDGAGHPLISYPDTRDRLKLLHCGDTSCAANNIITAPDPGNFEGMSSSLVLDAHGNPVISYSDDSLGSLRLLHCADPVCNAPATGSGDVNCDGQVDSTDATLVLQYGAALLNSFLCPAAADANGDGQINATDAALILQYAARFISHMPI